VRVSIDKPKLLGNESEKGEESEHDDFLDKRRREVRLINLYLQMPEEIFVEIVKDFAANFYDISRQETR
jgi:hypothetical protein